MSIISGLAAGLSQFIGGIGGGLSAIANGGTTSAPDSSAAQSLTQQLGGTPRKHRHGSSPLFQQIQQSVTTALQNSKTAGGSSDPNTIVKNAIAQVLQNNGLAGGDSEGDSDASGAADTASNSSTSVSNFFSTLQSNGVSPDQFRKDLVSALEQSQGGDTSATGLLLNTTG